MTPIRHPHHRDRARQTGMAPDHDAAARCPRCHALIPEDDRGVDLDCPGCGQPIRYISLEDRLARIEEDLRDIEAKLDRHTGAQPEPEAGMT